MQNIGDVFQIRELPTGLRKRHFVEVKKTSDQQYHAASASYFITPILNACIYGTSEGEDNCIKSFGAKT